MDIGLIKSLILFTCGFIEIVFAIIYWIKRGDRESIYLSWVAFFSSFYCFSYGIIFFVNDNLLFWYRTSWVGLFILSSGFIFCYNSTGKARNIISRIILIYLLSAVLFAIALFTPYFVENISEISGKPEAGPLDPFGRVYILALAGFSGFYLAKGYSASSGRRKAQLKLFLIGVIVNYFGSALTAGLIPLFFPSIGYNFVTPILTLPGIIIITYAILKERLFEVRLVLTEMLVGTIGAIMLAQAILAESISRQILGFCVLVISLVMGYILIKVTGTEIKKTEEAKRLAQKLKKLNETLEQKVDERTKKLRESYNELKDKNKEFEKFYNLVVNRELEMIDMKKKLKELEKLK